MNAYNFTFYDLITAALGKNDNPTIQGFLDTYLAQKYNGLQLDGFEFAPDMQLDFVYEQLIKSVDITPMAQYVDVDSPAVPLGTKGFEAWTGKIPRMKLVEYLNEDKVRKMMIAEQRFGRYSDRIHEMAVRELFVTSDKLIGAHTNSLTYQRHQMVSTGKFTINSANNPNGISGITLSAHVPSKNVKTLKGEERWWKSYDPATGKYSDEGANANPIQVLQDMVEDSENVGVYSVHFEIDKRYAKQLIRHSKIVEALAMHFFTTGITESWVKNKISQDMTFEQKLAGLGDIVGAQFIVRDSVSTVQKWDASKEELSEVQMRGFADNTLVLVPDGKLGEVVTVEPIAVGDGTYASFYGGRLLMTVGYDAVKKCQSFNTEMTSLVVPDKPQYMWYLHPYGTV